MARVSAGNRVMRNMRSAGRSSRSISHPNIYTLKTIVHKRSSSLFLGGIGISGCADSFINCLIHIYNYLCGAERSVVRMEENELKRMRSEVREIQKPVVMKTKIRMQRNYTTGKDEKEAVLEIVYQDRIEIYKLEYVSTKKEIDEEAYKDGKDTVFDYENAYGKGWNKAHEVEMLKHNGFRNVQCREEKEVD